MIFLDACLQAWYYFKPLRGVFLGSPCSVDLSNLLPHQDGQSDTDVMSQAPLGVHELHLLITAIAITIDELLLHGSSQLPGIICKFAQSGQINVVYLDLLMSVTDGRVAFRLSS